MRDPDWYGVVAGVIALGVLILGGLAIVGEGKVAPPAPGPRGPDYLYLTVAFNPSSGIDQYFPANFTVPSHTLVVISITNYDDGTNQVPAALGLVTGTIGGTESVSAGGSASAHSVTSVPLTGLAHTFSVGSIGLNAPIPSATDPSTPSVTSFVLMFNQSGTLVWYCQAPCDPMSMMMMGFMSGVITVV